MFLTWKCLIIAWVHLVPELFWNEIHVVKCRLFYFRKLKSLTLLKTSATPGPPQCVPVHTHWNISFEYSVVSVFLEANFIWRAGWSYKMKQYHFWPGLWWCSVFFFPVHNFAMLETRPWVWSWSVFNSENMLVLDNLWRQPSKEYQFQFQAINTPASRWFCSNPDISPRVWLASGSSI